jgi:hypothetical protein
MLSSRRRAVCLDIPFYRTVFSDNAVSGRASAREQDFTGLGFTGVVISGHMHWISGTDVVFVVIGRLA